MGEGAPHPPVLFTPSPTTEVSLMSSASRKHISFILGGFPTGARGRETHTCRAARLQGVFHFLRNPPVLSGGRVESLGMLIKPAWLSPRPFASQVCVSSRDGCFGSLESLPRDRVFHAQKVLVFSQISAGSKSNINNGGPPPPRGKGLFMFSLFF